MGWNMSEAKAASGSRKILTEPLSIFVLVAVAIFGYNAWSGSTDASDALAAGDADVVVIDDATVAMLQENFTWLEGRRPSEAETQTLISQWVDEEVLFREALAQRMHLSDSKMRAHLVEKVRMLWAGSPEPVDEAELLDFYMQNMEQYYTEPTLSFTQVYFEQLPTDPETILATLQAGGSVNGEAFWLARTSTAIPKVSCVAASVVSFTSSCKQRRSTSGLAPWSLFVAFTLPASATRVNRN
jgi:hypothetical protein